jgi:hypothetical protein
MTDAKSIAVAYYKALAEKNIEAVSKCLHADVHFIAPLAEARGKESVLKAAEGFVVMFKALTIHAQFGSENQAVVIYDIEVPGLAKNLASASFLSLKEGLIAKIELFYDPRSLLEMTCSARERG